MATMALRPPAPIVCVARRFVNRQLGQPDSGRDPWRVARPNQAPVALDVHQQRLNAPKPTGRRFETSCHGIQQAGDDHAEDGTHEATDQYIHVRSLPQARTHCLGRPRRLPAVDAERGRGNAACGPGLASRDRCRRVRLRPIRAYVLAWQSHAVKAGWETTFAITGLVLLVVGVPGFSWALPQRLVPRGVACRSSGAALNGVPQAGCGTWSAQVVTQAVRRRADATRTAPSGYTATQGCGDAPLTNVGGTACAGLLLILLVSVSQLVHGINVSQVLPLAGSGTRDARRRARAAH